MLRILIVGGDGAIGAAASSHLSALGHDVVTTTRRRPLRPDQLFLDLADVSTVASLPRCDVAIISAAMSRFADCRDFPQEARRINVDGPLAVSERLAASGSRLVLLSTSAVFDGTIPTVAAQSPPSPSSEYGRLKAEAEAGILELGAVGSVLRLSKVVAPGMALLQGWAKALESGQAVSAFNDMTISPVRISDVTGAIEAVVDDGDGGIYQVSGADDLSYVEVAEGLARRLDVDPGLVRATQAASSGIPAEQAMRFSSLDTSRLVSLVGFRPPTLDQVFDAVLGRRAAAHPRA